jgi:hypothetical protein
MGKPLVRFCEGQEINGDMEEIVWHRRESRRQRKKTNFFLQSRETPVYSKVMKYWSIGTDQETKEKCGVFFLSSGGGSHYSNPLLFLTGERERKIRIR